jgi:hypothetical protein
MSCSDAQVFVSPARVCHSCRSTTWGNARAARKTSARAGVRDDALVDQSEERQSLRLLWGAFAIQVAGRLLDFWWHATHDEFETGGDQLQAHWLVWIGTILVLVVGIRAVRAGVSGAERGGYLTVVVANALYVPIAVAHFIQHMNHKEVDWAHAGLGITNVVAALGVLYVGYASMRGRRIEIEKV